MDSTYSGDRHQLTKCMMGRMTECICQYISIAPNISIEGVKIIHQKMYILKWILIISETACALDNPCLVT